MWNQKCFPDWKQKKPSLWTKTDNGFKNPNIGDENSKDNIDMKSCVEDFLKQVKNLKNKKGGEHVEENDLLNILTRNTYDENLNEDTNSIDEYAENNEDLLLNNFDVNNISDIKINASTCSASFTPQKTMPTNDRTCQMCWLVILKRII